MSGLIALAIAMGIGRFAFTPVLPMMQADAGLSVAAGGWLASANYLGYLIGALAALAMRFSHGSMIRIGLVAVGAATIAMAFSDSYALWLVLRFIAGLASAWVLVYVSAWGFGRPEAVFSGVGIGIAIAGLVCLVLMVAGIGYRVAWFMLGAIAIAATWFVWSAFARQDDPAPVAEAARWQWNGETTRLTASYFAFGFGYIIPATFLPAMARDVIADPKLFGLSWPILGAVAAASTFFAAPLRRRFGDRKVWIGGQVLMACGVAVLAMSSLSAVLRTTLSAVLVGGTFVVVTMAAIQEGRRIAGPHGARLLIAAMTVVFAVGQIAGPVLVGLTNNIGVSLVLAAGLLLAGALLLLRGL